MKDVLQDVLTILKGANILLNTLAQDKKQFINLNDTNKDLLDNIKIEFVKIENSLQIINSSCVNLPVKYDTPISRALDIANFLDISLDYIYGRSNNPNIVKEEDSCKND